MWSADIRTYVLKMGSNKRYPSIPPSQKPHPYTIGKQPVSLTSLELEEELARAKTGSVSALAWVHFGQIAELIECTATAWSEHAVRVEFEGPLGEHRQVWVWRGAVRQP